MKKLSLIVTIGFIFVIGCAVKPTPLRSEKEAVTPLAIQSQDSISDDGAIKQEPPAPTPIVEVNPGGPYPFDQHAKIVEEWYNTIDVYRLYTLPASHDWANEFGDFDFFHLDNGHTVLVFDNIYEEQIAQMASIFASDNNLEYIIEKGADITAIFAAKDLWHIHSSWTGVSTLIPSMKFSGQTASDMTLVNPESWEEYVEESR